MWIKDDKVSDVITDLLLDTRNAIVYSFKLEEDSNVIYIVNRATILGVPSDILANIYDIKKWKKEE